MTLVLVAFVIAALEAGAGPDIQVHKSHATTVTFDYGCKSGSCLDTEDGHLFILESDFVSRSRVTMSVGQAACCIPQLWISSTHKPQAVPAGAFIIMPSLPDGLAFSLRSGTYVLVCCLILIRVSNDSACATCLLTHRSY
jgi:hypothetical protein